MFKELKQRIIHFNIKHRKNFFILLFVLSISFQIGKLLFFNDGVIAKIGADGETYICFLENFYKYGTWKCYNNYSGRMPGLMLLYVPFRTIFDHKLTINISIIIQILLYVLSIFLFSFIIKKAFNLSNFFTILLIILLGFTDYITIWASYYYTETLSISTLLISIYFLLKSNFYNRLLLFLSGLFFAWSIFLRPFLIVPFIVFAICLLINDLYTKKKFSFIFFLLPFIIFDSLWVYRNFKNENKFIFLQSNIYANVPYSNSYLKLRNLIKSFGEDCTEWNPGSLGMWFQSNDYLLKYKFNRPPNESLPKNLLSIISLDSLIKIRNYFIQANDNVLPYYERKYADSIAANSFDKIVHEYKKKAPINFYLVSRIKLTLKFIIFPYTYYLSLPENYNIFHFLVKLFIYFLNTIIIVGGFISFLIISIHLIFKRSFLLFLLMLFPAYIFALFPLYLGLIEYRFNVVAVPFLAFSISFLFDKLYLYFSKYIQKN